ncbi:MAG: hypothetical protein B6U78_02100 [Candidatus Aenigmarchaeota archaeon ex4484_224]|nr:MAG: hypothetical protein B6U78_02100 [Candidatus Aenigmarchaeota archaeon ex4484_224]
MRKHLVFILIVFIASFSLFYIFDSLGKLAEDCKAGKANPEICEKFSGLTFNMIIILLFIAGFIFLIVISAYIMILSSW